MIISRFPPKLKETGNFEIFSLKREKNRKIYPIKTSHNLSTFMRKLTIDESHTIPQQSAHKRYQPKGSISIAYLSQSKHSHYLSPHRPPKNFRHNSTTRDKPHTHTFVILIKKNFKPYNFYVSSNRHLAQYKKRRTPTGRDQTFRCCLNKNYTFNAYRC